MEIEPILFNSGLNLKKSPLLLKEGELVVCEGFSYDYDGVMTPRASVRVVNTATVGSIHSIHRSINRVLLGDDGNLRVKWDLDGYCNRYTPENNNFTLIGTLASSNKWRSADYAGFTFIATENDLYAFSCGYMYNCCSLMAPTYAPSVSSTGGSGSDTDHTWYYTYVYRFPNGHIHETGLSPGKTISAKTTGPTATITVSNSTMYPIGYSTIGGSGGNDSFAKILLHGEGADESQTIIDSSPVPNTIASYGDAKIDTAQYKFGASSIYFDGTAYLRIDTTSATLNFGTADFTVDAWIYIETLAPYADYNAFYSHYQDSTNYWTFGIQTESGPKYGLTMRFYDAGAWKGYYTASGLTASELSGFHHITFVRSGTGAYIFLDGVSKTLTTTTAFGLNNVDSHSSTGTYFIGSLTTLTNFMTGWMDEFRVSIGKARWTSNFAVPTAIYDTTYPIDVQFTLEGIDVFWKAYKTSDDIGDIYECYDGTDKTAITATDSYDDSTVLDNPLCETDEFGAWPSGIKDVCTHLQRLFGIKGNKLYYSEPYLPFSVDSSSNVAVTSDGEDLTAIVEWGDQLFFSSSSTWYRLVGVTSTTWSVKNSFSEVGTINKHTVKKCLVGIVSLWYDGIYLFDGYRSRNITDSKIGKDFFSNIASFSDCYAEYHNNKYYFYYPSAGTTPDKCLMIDFTNFPDLKFYNDNFVPNAFQYHVPTGIKYYGKTDGYQYESGGSEVIATSLQTGDAAMKSIMRRKELQYLFYDINCNSKTVSISVYVDGSVGYTFTLSGASRVRDRHLLPKLEGYRFSVSVSCSNSTGICLYEPWGIGYSYAGE